MITDSNLTTNPSIPAVEGEDEIDLMAIAKTIWGGRKTILISIFIGAILGVFVAQPPSWYLKPEGKVSQV